MAGEPSTGRPTGLASNSEAGATETVVESQAEQTVSYFIFKRIKCNLYNWHVIEV